MKAEAGELFQQTEEFWLSFETNRKGLIFVNVNKVTVFLL
jgi:hypothetical protein